MNPRPKWTPARRTFKEALWRQQRLPSCAPSSAATAKSRPISRKFGKPRETRNPKTVALKNERRIAKRHNLEVAKPLEGPSATEGAYQRAEVKPTSWRDWPDERLQRLQGRDYQGSSSSDSEVPSTAQSPSPSRDRSYTPARCPPTAAPISKSAPTQKRVDHGGGDTDTESQDTAAESASSRVAWGNHQRSQLRQAVSAWQARQKRHRHGEDTIGDVWSLLE